MRPLSGGSRQPLAPEQAEEGSGELWVQGLPNQTLREATLARPQHEQSGDVPAGVTHCSKEVDPGERGAETAGRCLCWGPLRENTHTTCLLKANIFHVSGKTTGLCSGYFPHEGFFLEENFLYSKSVFTYKEFEIRCGS